jgi:hypothetical protein
VVGNHIRGKIANVVARDVLLIPDVSDEIRVDQVELAKVL